MHVVSAGAAHRAKPTTSRIAVALLLLLFVLSCNAKPKPTQASYIPLLAQLAANPKAQKATSTKEDKLASTSTYADSPGIKALVMTVARDRPAGWRLTFESTKGELSPYDFAPGWLPGAPTTASMPSEWFELQDGPLKGSVVHLPGYIGSLGTPGKATKAEVFSAPFFLGAAFAFQETGMLRWACETGRGGIKAIPIRDFATQCEDAVRTKLPSASNFSSNDSIRASAECEYAWPGEVDGKTFMCTFDPKKKRVEVHVAGH